MLERIDIFITGRTVNWANTIYFYEVTRFLLTPNYLNEQIVNCDRFSTCIFMVQGPVSWKFRKRFGPVKPFSVHLYLKVVKRIRLEPRLALLDEGNLGQIKSMCLNSSVIIRFDILLLPFRVRKRFRTFLKRAPGVACVTLWTFILTDNYLFN